jgi:putative inorganic carbon (hco3(-)) transporter
MPSVSERTEIFRPRGPKFPTRLVEKESAAGPSPVGKASEIPCWTLAYVAILGYVLVQYSRVQEMYPILQPLHLAKVLVVLCAAGLFASPRIRVEDRFSRRFDRALLVFILGVFASAVFAQFSERAWPGFFDALTWAVTAYLVSRILVSAQRLRIFVFLILLLNFKLAQFVVRYYFYLRSIGRDQKWLATQGVGAGTDFFGNSADLGLAMVVALALAASLLFGERKKSIRLMLWACAGAFFAAILLCGSRGALVGAAAVALTAWRRSPKRVAGVAILILLSIGTYAFLPDGMKAKMNSAWDWQDDPTAFHRTLLWKAGLQMFFEHPVFGVGVANYGRVYFINYPNYIEEEPRERWFPRAEWVPHSTYIQTLSELGLAGAIPLLMLGIVFFGVNAHTRRHLKAVGLADRSSFEYRLVMGLDLAMVGYLVSGAFIAVLYYPHFWLLLGLSVALNTACLQKHPKTGKLSQEGGYRRRPFGLVSSHGRA